MNMDRGIAIEILGWESQETGLAEERVTAASISIRFGEHVATRVDDRRSQSIRDFVHVSAYPLALWIASSWWRLRWEPSLASARAILPWKMAHEVAASGWGYTWPTLTLVSDGENFEVWCRPSRPTTSEPIRYIENFSLSFPASSFEREVDAFIDVVLERLRVFGLHETDLEKAWNEVRQERDSPDVSQSRMMEARLGYEPDEAPADIVSRFISLSERVGHGAVAEIAPVCAGNDPGTEIDKIIDLARQPGLVGEVRLPGMGRDTLGHIVTGTLRPWETGWELARRAREALAFPEDVVSDDLLGDMLGLSRSDLGSVRRERGRGAIGLAVRNGGGGNVRFHFSGGAKSTQRFEAARFVADFLMAPVTDHWLPATRAKTSRQKAQRAFAAEFLCPIRLLAAYLDNEYSEEAIEAAAIHFGVSPICVSSHLANNGYLHPGEVPAWEYPYGGGA